MASVVELPDYPGPSSRCSILMWFLQIEELLDTANITCTTIRYHCVVGSLDFDTLEDVIDVINDPTPTANPYTRLKDYIIKRSVPIKTALLFKALLNTPILDDSPANLLIWFRKLPAEVRASIDQQHTAHLSLDNTAALADSVFFAHKLPQPEPEQCKPHTPKDLMEKQKLQLLRLEIKKMKQIKKRKIQYLKRVKKLHDKERIVMEKELTKQKNLLRQQMAIS